MEGQIDLDALERAAMAATPGPWADDGWEHVGACSSDQANNGYFVAECCGPDRKKNMAHIAAANPAVILSLVGRVRTTEQAVAPAATIVLAGHEFEGRGLVHRVMRNLRPRRGQRNEMRWVLAMGAFGVGSAVARALCREFNLDPDEVIE